ncbi:unnamed protein product [Ectocarpus fasciculatus]
MTINLNAFVGSCRPVGDALMAKQPQHHVVSSRCGLPRLRCSPSHQSSRSSSPRTDSMSPEKESRSVAIEKRSKQYFFKLLSAARTRDKRLLASTMKSLGADKEYLKQMRTADPKVADPLQVQDVLLKAASRCGQPIFADRVFTAMLDRGQRPTQHTAGAFLDALKRDRQADRCVSAYTEMMDKGVDLGDVCFNIVVSALVQDGNFAGGLDMLERASTGWGIDPDAYTFNLFFSAAAKTRSSASRDAAKKAEQLMSRLGVAPDRITINARIDHAIKQGRLDEAIETFERALDGDFPGVVPDVITFNVGIAAYMARNRDDTAFKLLEEMNRREIRPRADTFNSILTGLTKGGDTLRVIEVFNKYLRQDDSGHGSSVAPTLVSYNLVLQALCLENDKRQARLVDAEMRRRGIKPDNITLAALVRLQFSREDVYNVMETARKLRIDPSLTFLNSCIRALGDHSDVYGAFQVMERIKALEGIQPDVFSYNSLIYALVQEPWVFEEIEDVGSVEDIPEVTALTASSSSRRADSKQAPLASVADVPSSHGSRIAGLDLVIDRVIGAEAALLLLEEMKTLPDACGVSPDIFTYTTVISGITRAEDARRAGRHVKQWWRTPRSGAGYQGYEGVRAADGGEEQVSSTELCTQLYVEATERGIHLNGKICNAVLVGFGADLTGAISFWRRCVRPALVQGSDEESERDAVDGISAQQTRRPQENRKQDLFSAYCGMLYVCGRAQRPDAALKVVFALKKDGIRPSSALSNTYFKAKKDARDSEDDSQAGPARFRVLRLLDRQLENTLEVECGVSKHADPMDLPIERIRIRF